MGAEVNGDAASSHTEGDSSPVASETSTNMSWPAPGDIQSQVPSRPSLNSHQSCSVPATPFHAPRGLRFSSTSRSRSPSPIRAGSSPRSAHSEMNSSLPHRKHYGGCKYETAMAHFRRRMPYSLGADLLPKDPGPLKQKLDPEDEKRLTSDMKALYTTLLPSPESEQRRLDFIQKLENLLNKQWPGNDIKVHVFGSSGNKLCSSDSDVDICITTPFKELEHVCMLAEFFAKNGMERVVCVSHAKVPIVKMWDPELQVACDMNVNNTMALENTRLIRTYVEVDDRVRPLAMILKHWTKRRILNDAALGGTLSSYTWICLIINFLQTRSPPILPSLQRRALDRKGSTDSDQPSPSFDEDLEKLTGFGQDNKSTLGELLFQFFRYYGHEIDYEKNVVSLREGKLVSKKGKGWHLLQNNRLCVEEPFNTSRNLGNTADDISFRGLHLELRRAFEAVSKGDLGECCKQFEYPEEERTWERPAPQPRTALTPMPAAPSRGGRGGGRGGRHSNHYHRGPNNMNRRASNSGNRNNMRPANPSFTADIALQAQQAQNLLHDHLFQRIQYLQVQEQEIRMQLQNQAFMTGRAPPTLIRQPYLHFPLGHENLSTDENPRIRAGSVNHPPLSAPIRNNVFFGNPYIPVAVSGVQGANTNPSSPSLAAATPEPRRDRRRSSVSNDSPRSLRAHSQPARPLPAAMLPTISIYNSPVKQDGKSKRSHETSHGFSNDADIYSSNGVPIPQPAFANPIIAPEYAGYYVGDATQPQGSYRGSVSSSLPGFVAHNCEMPAYLHGSPEYQAYAAALDQSNLSPRQLSPPKPAPLAPQTQRSSRAHTLSERGPLIIDGSRPSENRHPSVNHSSEQFMTDFSASSSADRLYDTPRTTPDTLSQGIRESNSYDDLFGSSYEPHQCSQVVGQTNGWDPAMNNDISSTSPMGRVETLSERLQRFQLADPHFTLDASGNGDTCQYRGVPYLYPIDDQIPDLHTDGSVEDNTVHEPLGKDSPIPPHTTNYGVNGYDSGKVNGFSHKSKTWARNDNHHSFVITDQGNHNDKKLNGTHPSYANAASNAHASNSNSWQTSTRRKSKKSIHKLPADQSEMIIRQEALSAGDSLRKGG